MTYLLTGVSNLRNYFILDYATNVDFYVSWKAPLLKYYISPPHGYI